MPLSFRSIAWIFDWAQSPTWKLAALLLLNILWIPMVWWFMHEVWDCWMNYINTYFHLKRQFVVLAVDVPRDTEQTPSGMEAIFNQLEGAHGAFTGWELKWQGAFQEWFAFEIVSIDGYVQYIVRCHKDLRDLVEASIYAQYPDAEITEVRDYVNDVPHEYPNEEWDFMGTEYNLAREDAYPIRVYREFEDKVRGELIDPMAALLEIMSKMGKGEQIWYQVLMKPIVDPDWVPEAQAIIDGLVEKERPAKENKSILRSIVMLPIRLIDTITGVVFPNFVGGGEEKSDSRPRTNVQNLTPGEKLVVEDMERKITKMAYKVRIRIIYIAKKEIFAKARGFGPVIGAVKQFNDATRNYFKVSKKSWTKANYALKKARTYARQNKFMAAYANRSLADGEAVGGYVLNTEELATIYHFPMASVKAPLLKRTGARKSEPPATLPVDFGEGFSVSVPERPDAPMPTASAASNAGDASPAEPSMNLPTADDLTFVDIPDDAPEPLPDSASSK